MSVQEFRARPALFIGRWQPFHEGHKKLIEVVLNEGQDVIIALRDTPITDKNPFTLAERRERITSMMKEWGNRVTIMDFPNIGSVIHGRDVGWEVREIRLDEQTENISGTKTREEMRTKGQL